MSDEIKKDEISSQGQGANVPSRRRLLKLGAASIPAIVTLNGGSALAQTQMSMGLANCSVTLLGSQVDAAKSFSGPPVTGSSDEMLNGQQVYDIYDPATDATGGFDFGYISELDKLTLAGSGVSCVTSIVTRMG